MNDNKSAFQSSEYDNKIIQTLPYYYDIYFDDNNSSLQVGNTI